MSADCNEVDLSPNLGAGPLAETNFVMKYYLYTEPTANKVHSFNSENFETEMKNIDYNRGAQWKVLVHGFLNNANTAFPVNVRNAYLEKMAKNSSAKYNVLVVDWGDGARISLLTILAPYRNAVENVKSAGQKLGHLLTRFYNSKILDVYDVHLIGHSLGAHVCGQAAREVYATLNRFVGRVSALDPAGPLFWRNYLFFGAYKPYPRIRRNRVLFLDVYHTSEMFGGQDEIGDVDFYVNGGKSQPSCDVRVFGYKILPSLFFQGCSHNYATEIFAKSINDNSMKGCTGCYSYSDYEKHECDCEDYPILGESVVDETIEGYPIASGTAYIKTNRDTSVGTNYLKMLMKNGTFE